MGKSVIIKVVDVERGDCEMGEGREALEYGDEDVVFKNGA